MDETQVDGFYRLDDFLQLALLNQLSELQSNQAKQQLRIPLELSSTLYGVVRGWVSHEALRKVEEQRKLLIKKDQSSFLTCTGVFSRVYGLPCLHILDILQGALLLDHFHSNWHLKHDGAPQLLLEPRQRIEPIQAKAPSHGQVLSGSPVNLKQMKPRQASAAGHQAGALNATQSAT